MTFYFRNSILSKGCLHSATATVSLSVVCTGDAQLILANHEDIRSFPLNGDRSSILIRDLHNCIALDYHYQYDYLYWTDVSLDVIKRSTLTGEQITTIVDQDLNNPGIPYSGYIFRGYKVSRNSSQLAYMRY